MISWSFKIGQVLGINVKIHISFLLFVVLITLAELFSYGLISAFFSLIFLLCIFVCVFLHELGHCVVAISHNYYVHDIILWPLGGIASIEAIGQNPHKEIEIALAGPIVNLILFFFLCPIALFSYFVFHSYFFIYLALVNLIMAVFNLIPAFPMDGGRIYRAWMSKRLGYKEANYRAARLAMILAVVIGILGIFLLAFELIIIAVFIFLAAKQELSSGPNFSLECIPEEHRQIILHLKEEVVQSRHTLHRDMVWIKKKFLHGKRKIQKFFKKYLAP